MDLLLRDARSIGDRLIDACVAATALHWAVLGVLGDQPLPWGVRIALSAINALVGLLFLARTTASERGAWLDIGPALPSIALSVLAYRIAPASWPLPLVIVHGAFAFIVLASLLALGRSFAILPARRPIVARGPYRLVRHPIYLGELGMLVTACASRGWIEALVGAAVVLALVMPRIVVEERMLGADEAYASYRARVPHRLLPGLF